MSGKKNHLAEETSPYLKQHVYNPVDWYPWSLEALNKAKNENKLIFISIGYSACHWCHVMEKESFVNDEIAALLNENYVSIKIDREERPDLDQTYMSAVQLITGGGGWPLSCFTTPEGKPFYGGTYYTPSQFKEILVQLNDIWTQDEEKIRSHADGLCEGIENSELVREKNLNEGLAEPESLYQHLEKEFDSEYGGLNRVPKFPMPSIYRSLLHYFHYSNNISAKEHALKTVDEIIKGGIYDQIGGGIARYSTDKIWQVPHFEKMLYDNAQFISLLSDAFLVSKNEEYLNKIYETTAFLERELYNGKGGFYSSLDADSEGEEGKFYVWSYEELASVAGGDKDLIFPYYGITKEGNWESGKNILSVSTSPEELSNQMDIGLDELKIKIRRFNHDLLTERNKRVRPGLDDKVLTAWNAMLAISFADAYQATGDKSFKERALRTGNYIREHMINPENDIYRTDNLKIEGFLDDYAFTCQAFLMFYQISFDESWLNQLKILIEKVLQNFYDEETAMFYYSSAKEENPVTRQHEFTDNVIPASNSVMAKVLLYASVYFDKSEYLGISRQMLFNVQPYISRSPSFFSNWFDLLLTLQSDFSEIVISGRSLHEKRKAFCGQYLPNILFAGTENQSELSLLKGRTGHEDTKIYVCRNRTCKMPVTTAKDALKQLKEG